MNSRTALPFEWRLLGACAAFVLSGITAFAASKKSATPDRVRQHETDVQTAERLPTPKDLLLPPEEEKKSEAIAAFVDGLIAEDAADGDKALAAFQKVLNLDPAYTDLAVKVAYEQARRGDVDQGINTLKDAIKARPKEPVPCIFLSGLYSKYLHKPEVALKYAEQALAIDPGNLAAHLALYDLFVTTNQPKKALQVLERVAAVQSDDPQFWLGVAEFYTKIYLKEDGTASPEGLKKINLALAKALAAAKEDPAVIAKAADFYVLSRQVKEAIPLYLTVLKLRKNAPADLSIANVQDKLARSLRVNGQREEAIGILEQLIKENPLRYESYELLGQLYEEKGDTDKALNYYQQTLLIDGSRPVNYLRVADMMIKSQAIDKAVEVLKDARKKFPDLPQITYSLAVALGQAKRYNDAIPVFEESFRESEERQPDMLNAAFYFSYGAASERAGLFDKAVELLRKSIELDPSNAAEAFNYLGYMWVEKGDNLDEAGDFIKRALELDPDNAAFLDSLGWLYYKKGDYDKAVKQLLKASELMKPEDAVVFEHIADAYAKLNNTAQALIYWQKALALDQDNKAIADKIENAKQKVTANPSGGSPAH